ncbi:hypothetical protein OHC33_006885 [Knufia fluminis]|uniref:Uncharacterized protein n=1 Tax=Knufia fluminis TaxID=191047 RepID=A0AAN8EC43_9EURO|nr:hypothetical protein OHC33_006885 [Knufia fluminis]
MIALLTFLTAFGLTALAESTTASTTASTTDIFLPIIDEQPLVASVSASSGDVKTMVIKCPDGTDSSKCGFPTPVTVTAGPSTVALTTVVGNSMTVDLKCGIDGSTKASCTQVYTGPASLYTSASSGDDGSKTTTWTASQSLDSGKVTFLPVTITAGLPTGTNKNAAGPVATPIGGIRKVAVVVAVAQLVAGVV